MICPLQKILVLHCCPKVTVCQAKFQKSVQHVLSEIPKSKLVLKPNHRKRLFEKQKVLREVKNTMDRDMNADSDMLVLQSRIS